MVVLGVFHSHSDPSAAVLVDDTVAAFVEEERLSRVKHAHGAFPSRAIRHVLERAGIGITEVDYVAQAWDCRKYDDGVVALHYEQLNNRYKTVDGDRAYQRKLLALFRSESQKSLIVQNLRREFGDVPLPEIRFVNHHLAHACAAYFGSGFDDALVLSVDGCGEEITTSWWEGRGRQLHLLKETKVPHSLGWLYSAMTEYLGFEAYDGEYKVMGLAAYGKADPELTEKVSKLAWYDGEGGLETDPLLVSRGDRRYSYYFPDTLVDHLGRPPRSRDNPLDQWHKDLGYAVQKRLEEIVLDMVRYWTHRTGTRRLCVSGGVGLNVKMNGALFDSGLVDDLFAHPLCSDLGQSIGAALALRYELAGLPSARLEHLFLGPSYTDEEIEQALKACKVSYERVPEIETRAAELIAKGKVVGWFQGRMEAGPRALGARSILADPRTVESRDKVNAVIKYREQWRPFCPSMTRDGAARYFERSTYAPFMILTFRANDVAAREIPAVVHVDGTSRPQIVDEASNPRYHRLIEGFNRLTGVPCVLNTSFNIKGEPIVCSPQDALRTFYATGLDALAIGNCLLRKGA